MKTHRLLALPLLVGLGAMACESDLGQEPNWITPGDTYEAQWVGVYEGMANAELLETGESFTDVPVCLDLLVSNGMLRGVVRIDVLPLDALNEDSDDMHPRTRQSRCGGGAATMTLAEPIEGVNSEHALRLEQEGATRPRAEALVVLLLERQGDDVVGSLLAPDVRVSFTMTKMD